MKRKVRQAVYLLLAAAAFALLIVVIINAQSPESLMSPPEASGDYKDIQKVIEKSIGSGIILKAPNTGEYTTAITFMDLTNDGENDAVAFYRIKTDDTSSIYMSVLVKSGSQWVTGASVKGKGNDILEFSYGDMDYDSVPEITVGWSMFDSKDNNTLSVYAVSFTSKSVKISETDSLIYTKMYVADVCGEGRKEIILVKNTYNDESSTAKATVYELEDKKLHSIGSLKLVSAVTEYKKIQKQKIDSVNVFYLDGVVDKDYMITEIFYWDSKKNVLVSPTDKNGAMPQTLRKGNVASMDINSDGKIEIPFSTDEQDSEYISLTSWMQFNGKDFSRVLTGLCQNGLIFNFPSAWKDKVAVTYQDNIWSFYDVTGGQRNKLFELAAVNISQWQQYSVKKFDKLTIDYGTIYGIKLSETSSKLMIGKNEIKQCIVNVR